VPGRAATSLKLRAADALDRVTRRHDPLVPPRRLQFVGEGDFVATGDEFLGHLVDLAGLKPTTDILDVGCGIGRMARPLAGHLTTGRYCGFDVNEMAIRWCREHYPVSFRFDVADLHNARYNPRGAELAREYRFPYEDASFDVVLMASVLTHLLEPEAERYLGEALRVLRPGGRLLATFFLLDGSSRAALEAGRAAIAFPPADGPVSVADPALPEEAVAYDLGWVRERLTVYSSDPGAWRGEPLAARSFQDLVVACA
jgi:SAM-dependent methyltransferase